MRFESSSSRMAAELEDRLTLKDRILKWGITYLDDATRGIFANDLVLLGAPPGLGKTALSINIAVTNLTEGKKVHYIALEAHPLEIERRIKYNYFANLFFSDNDRPKLNGAMNFKTWCLGDHKDKIKKYEDITEEFSRKAFVDLFTLYKDSKFRVEDLIKHVNFVADETDLIIVDHAHYFDWDEESDNNALKRIVHSARGLTQDIGRPILLVAHLRKKDRGMQELAPGMDDFHGSSELTKVSTKCITLSPGSATDDGKYITYFRVAKDRLDGGPTRYLGITTYNPKKGGYDDEYTLTWANASRVAELSLDQYPDWARHGRASSNSNPLLNGGGTDSFTRQARPKYPKRMYVPD
jgi:hypothetical protein